MKPSRARSIVSASRRPRRSVWRSGSLLRAGRNGGPPVPPVGPLRQRVGPGSKLLAPSERTRGRARDGRSLATGRPNRPQAATIDVRKGVPHSTLDGSSIISPAPHTSPGSWRHAACLAWTAALAPQISPGSSRRRVRQPVRRWQCLPGPHLHCPFLITEVGAKASHPRSRLGT
jgi:hypothetical protein